MSECGYPYKRHAHCMPDAEGWDGVKARLRMKGRQQHGKDYGAESYLTDGPDVLISKYLAQR